MEHIVELEKSELGELELRSLHEVMVYGRQIIRYDEPDSNETHSIKVYAFEKKLYYIIMYRGEIINYFVKEVDDNDF